MFLFDLLDLGLRRLSSQLSNLELLTWHVCFPRTRGRSCCGSSQYNYWPFPQLSLFKNLLPPSSWPIQHGLLCGLQRRYRAASTLPRQLHAPAACWSFWPSKQSRLQFSVRFGREFGVADEAPVTATTCPPAALLCAWIHPLGDIHPAEPQPCVLSFGRCLRFHQTRQAPRMESSNEGT